MPLINPIHSLSFVLISVCWRSLQQEVFQNQTPGYPSDSREGLSPNWGGISQEKLILGDCLAPA